MESYSQIGQDLKVLEILCNKKDGTYVDIGCSYPKNINNTFLLEKNYGWRGISIDKFDISDPDGKTWDEIRPNSNRIIYDALDLDYKEVFKSYKLPTVIDFLSLDLEPPELTLKCLFKIPFNQYTFNVITFETDEYREGGEERKNKSREYLTSLGYIFIENIGKQDDIYISNKIDLMVQKKGWGESRF